MNNAMLKSYVQLQVLRARMADRVTDERGEVGSWLIYAGLLAVAAAAVAGIVEQWLTDRANELPGGGG